MKNKPTSRPYKSRYEAQLSTYRAIYGGNKNAPIEKDEVIDCDFAALEKRYLSTLMNTTESEDRHRALASEIFLVSYADVTDEQRRYAKSVAAFYIYGGAGKTISK